jgi:hypothetical protein
MAKRSQSRKRSAKRKSGSSRSGNRRSGGRVEPTPHWEAVWRRASSESNNLYWDIGEESERQAPVDNLPSHGEVFRTLDALASADDGLGTLAVLAGIFDATEGVCDVESQLRSVASKVTSRSEAALFGGYVSPQSASAADGSATAGRLLRAHRERDLDEMVAAANANASVFVERPNVGLLTFAPLLAYELFRPETEVPLSEHVADFLEDGYVPFAGAEYLLKVVLVSLIGENVDLPEDLEGGEMVVRVAERILENRPMVEHFLLWALRLEAEMNRSKTATVVHQCGAEFGSAFARESTLLAILVSENRAFRRFRRFEPPAGSVYGLWQSWLAHVSPKGHTLRTVGAFSPEDLATAWLAGLDVGVVERLFRVDEQQAAMDEPVLESGDRAIGRRVNWLTGLARLLAGDAEIAEVFKAIEWDLPVNDLFGPAGPTVAAMSLYAWLVLELEMDESEMDESEMAESLAFLHADATGQIATELGVRIQRSVEGGHPAEDEFRALRAWVDLLSEIVGTGTDEPAPGFDITEVGDDLARWLANVRWWLEHRGWRPKKERPETEEISVPEPVKVQPPEPPVPTVGVEPLVPDQPMTIVFAGGSERQRRIGSVIDGDLAERYRGLVAVAWVHTDWSAQWKKEAARIYGYLDRGAEAVVLMPLVRTGMGQEVRREVGRRNVPWVPCTAHGKGAMTRSIDEAVQVVCRRRST